MREELTVSISTVSKDQENINQTHIACITSKVTGHVKFYGLKLSLPQITDKPRPQIENTPLQNIVQFICQVKIPFICSNRASMLMRQFFYFLMEKNKKEMQKRKVN